MSITRATVNASQTDLGIERLLGDIVDSKAVKVQPTPAAKTVTVTLTAAEVLTGLITGNQGGAAAASYTLPTGAALEAAFAAVFPALANDDAFDFVLINLSVNAAEDITVLTNTGLTLVGSMVVESNEATAQKSPFGTFRIRRTAASTFTVYRIA